jgi:hypothetical protein
VKTPTFGLAFFFVRLYVCAVFEGLIAGKPAPTEFYVGRKIVNKTQILWERAYPRWRQSQHKVAQGGKPKLQPVKIS